MKLFRTLIRETSVESGAAEVLLNLEQIVFVMPNPYMQDTCMLRMTGEANVFLVLAPFEDVRQAIEEANE